MIRIVVTTSRHPTPPVRRLAREFASLVYGGIRVNRGSMNEEELFSVAKEYGASRIVIFSRGRGGNPGRVTFIDTTGDKPLHIPFILWLRGVVFLSRAKRAESETPIFSMGECGGLPEEFSLAMGIPYLGRYTAEDSRSIVVECVARRRLLAVIKFIEEEREIGVKLLVEKVVQREW